MSDSLKSRISKIFDYASSGSFALFAATLVAAFISYVIPGAQGFSLAAFQASLGLGGVGLVSLYAEDALKPRGERKYFSNEKKTSNKSRINMKNNDKSNKHLSKDEVFKEAIDVTKSNQKKIHKVKSQVR